MLFFPKPAPAAGLLFDPTPPKTSKNVKIKPKNVKKAIYTFTFQRITKRQLSDILGKAGI